MQKRHLKKAIVLLSFFGCFFCFGQAHAASLNPNPESLLPYTYQGITYTGVVYNTSYLPGGNIPFVIFFNNDSQIILDSSGATTTVGALGSLVVIQGGLYDNQVRFASSSLQFSTDGICDGYDFSSGCNWFDISISNPSNQQQTVFLPLETYHSTIGFVVGSPAFTQPPDNSFLTNIPVFAGTTTLEQGTQYSSSTIGTSTLVNTTNLLSFLNVPKLLSTKVPFGYFFQAKDAIINGLNGSSTTPIPSGTFKVKIGNSTTTVDMFSTSTVGYFLSPTLTLVLRNLMLTVIIVEFLYLLYLRGKATHII